MTRGAPKCSRRRSIARRPDSERPVLEALDGPLSRPDAALEHSVPDTELLQGTRDLLLQVLPLHEEDDLAAMHDNDNDCTSTTTTTTTTTVTNYNCY